MKVSEQHPSTNCTCKQIALLTDSVVVVAHQCHRLDQIGSSLANIKGDRQTDEKKIVAHGRSTSETNQSK